MPLTESSPTTPTSVAAAVPKMYVADSQGMLCRYRSSADAARDGRDQHGGDVQPAHRVGASVRQRPAGVRCPQVQYDAQQDRQRAQGEAQGHSGPLQGLKRKRQRLVAGVGRVALLPAACRGSEQVGRQGRHGQGDDHHFRGHRYRQQLDDQDFGPQQCEDGQVDVDAHAADDQVGIGVGVDCGQDQNQGEKSPTGVRDNGRWAGLEHIVEVFEEGLVQPVAGNLGPQEQQQPGGQERLPRPEKGQAESLPGEGAVTYGKGPFAVQEDQSQGQQQCGGGRDVPELSRMEEHQKPGHGHAPGQNVDEEPIAEHAGGGGIEQAADQRGRPEVAIECNQVVGMVEIEVKGHDQAGQQREGPSGGLVAGAHGDEPAAAQQGGVAQPQNQSDHLGVLEDSQGRQPDDQAHDQQGAAQGQQPLNAAGIEHNLPERPSWRSRRWRGGCGTRRGSARGGAGGRRVRGRLPAWSGRCLHADLCLAGRIVVEDDSRDRLGLLLQSCTENGDPPFGALDAGVGMRQRHAAGFTVRLDHRTGVCPVAQFPHLRRVNRHSANGTVRG